MTLTSPTLLSADDKFGHDWDRCKRYIEDALEYAGGSHSIDDVRDFVLAGKAQFHPLPISCIITEIVDYPQKSMCRIWLAGGNLEELMQAEKSIAHWAKSIGCDGMEIVGRKGWSRQLKDYRESAVVLMKDFKNE